MNFLQLAQAVKRESGLSGGAPASLATAKGDDARIFQWVNWAWRDIALMHESWFFRRGEALGETSAMVMSPTASAPGFALTDWATWKPQADDYRPSAWRLTDGQAAEYGLQYLPYDTFRRRFIVGVHSAGPVRFWSVDPSGDLLVAPTPDSAHQVRASYIRDVVDMTADADEPAMPQRFHMMIVWRALREYGGFDAASEVVQRADQNYNMLMSALTQSQLPAPGFGARPLA